MLFRLAGLRGTGKSTNIWTWELSDNWTIHITFMAANHVEHMPLLDILGNTSQFGIGLPSRPHAMVINYGIHFTMTDPDKKYQQMLYNMTSQLQQQLIAMWNICHC